MLWLSSQDLDLDEIVWHATLPTLTNDLCFPNALGAVQEMLWLAKFGDSCQPSTTSIYIKRSSLNIHEAGRN